MVVMSKLAGDLGLTVSPMNCYEFGHTWHPSCVKACIAIFKASAWDSFKVYATLYVVSFLARSRKLSKANCRRILLDTLRSTAFLTTNAFMFMACLCSVRKLQGFWVLPHLGFTNSLIASFVAILVEKKNRRPMLALYLTNLASEVAFNMAYHRGWVGTIPRGQAFIFSAAMAGYFYLRKSGKLSDAMESGMEFIFSTKREDCWISKTKFLGYVLDKLKGVTPRSRSCKHNHGCLHFSLEGFFRNFFPAYLGSVGLSVVTGVPRLLKRPSRIPSTIVNSRSLKTAFFFALLPALSSGTTCALNHILKRNTKYTAAVSGGVAGLAMLVYPSTSIAMYALWKLIEIVYHIMVEKGFPLRVPHGDILLYSFSTAFVLYAAVVEPHALRPTYWSFLQSLTGNMFGQVNRSLIREFFGTDSDKLFPHFNVKLDPKYTTANPLFLKAQSFHSPSDL